MKHLCTLTTSMATALFAGLCIGHVLAAIVAIASHDKKLTHSNILGAIIMLIAYTHYRWIKRAQHHATDDEQSSGTNQMPTRYSDWFLTLPLLYLELCVLSEIPLDSPWVWAGILSIVLMLGAGYTCERHGHPYLLWVGFVLLLSVFLCFLLARRSGCTMFENAALQTVVVIALVLWVLYGVTAWWYPWECTYRDRVCPEGEMPTFEAPHVHQKHTMYNLLDIASKGGLALFVILWTVSNTLPTGTAPLHTHHVTEMESATHCHTCP